VNLTLVGDEHLIWKELGKDRNGDNSIQIHHCSQRVDMDELPLKVLRHRKDVSITVAFDLSRRGDVDAVIRAGNSGATVGAAVLILGRLRGRIGCISQ
jgi:glycerol-3-phosphate acyltransferase PlsX